MPEYLSPGVYVEEAQPSARPIAGVGTSTAGFIGVVPDDVTMPLLPGRTGEKADGTPEPDDFYKVVDAGKPQLITSWEQFKNKFGDFQKQKTGTGGWGNSDYTAYLQIQHAIYGFFNNGGTRCWILRVKQATDLADLTDDLKKFEPIDEIAIVAVPGVTTKPQQDAIIDHCENMLDRVAILDGTQKPAKLTVDDIKGGTPTAPTKDSKYAALYFPWINVFDPISKENIPQPPSGHIAGVYARVDGERGVHKAPANEIVRGAADLDTGISRLDQNGLNPKGINVIRAFNGNFKIWGGRTLGGDDNGDFRYISTRRFFNFLRESIDEGTQWVVFEPNSPALWQRIKRTVSDFLLRQWRDGALFGETPERAFFVKCDEDTNPAEVREVGQVVTEIGVAIVKPAEFVIFRIQQTTGG
ncbi:MAG: phage tail sheath family protein [Candidatus Jettenia sp.]|uniref:Putative phage tail sheath protein n=1 Tax=Candidatus Jettenia caeni TaxID=247490 RepID=I3IIB0_9BACT|nr:phage tail sheath subtilisin-like domain-containing protein [Candidatus Jettenia sp. AMX1]MBC6928305.1 phage tail sheath family protein [Candidatus Jettenia sp.]NUN21968.1 phage tail sheath family protein [Candidatus Jettenia caeni]KAA0249934.1 MAG: phage tail sheath family protein [Candidatus Jettenia sp. AMX1]MCE7880412.1 phage tail sheath family protein [Candidatus Jettenia sp. AMX1]MCQ3926220.1 phage tail sheath family protein [Candidatus Jettenia sp.]